MFIVLLMNTFGHSESKYVECESVSNDYWGEPVGNVYTCRIFDFSSIDEPNVFIVNNKSPDRLDDLQYLRFSSTLRHKFGDGKVTIKALAFWGNKNIKYLPVRVATSFPNLLAYDATSCALKEISYQNFEHLYSLKLLDLGHNEIASVSIDAFKDLRSLKRLQLSELSLMDFWTFNYLCLFFLRFQQNQILER